MDYQRFPVGGLLARPGDHLDVEVAVPVTVTTDAVRLDGTAVGTVRLEAASGALIARGRVRVPAVTTCGRCLIESDDEVEATFTVTYGNPDDEDSYPIPADRRIDLASPLREEVAMAVPVAPLCSDDCLGLCATCGTDLNREPCAGHEDLSSSPFASLERLFPPE